MNNDNKFDQSFRERMRGFEASPSEQVWLRIEAELRGKKKRRIIPIWWRLSGVAAALILAAAIYYTAFRRTESSAGKVVEQRQDNGRVPGAPVPSGKIHRKNAVPLGQAVAGEDAGIPVSGSHDANPDPVKKPDGRKSKTLGQNIDASDAVAAGENANPGNAAGNPQQQLRKPSVQKNGAVRHVPGTTAVAASGNPARLDRYDANQPGGQRGNRNVAAENTASNVLRDKDRIVQRCEPAKTALAASEKPTSEKGSNPAVKSYDTDASTPDKKTPAPESGQVAAGADAQNKETQTPNTGLVQKPETKKDSAAIATAGPNTLEELLHEKEKQVTSTGLKSRWEVTPSVAPIYFGSASNGSPLDSRFEKNKKSYTPSLSYGVGAKYAVSKKLAVRAGVHALKLEYNTGDLVFSQAANARKLENVTPNLQGSMIEIDNKPSYPSVVGRSIDSYGGQVTQKIGYVEIPVELSYKLIDRKFGVELIGGVSTLVLNDNQVLLLSDGLQMPIGEADNLNRVHFSSNLGIGLRYNFLKSFQASVDPMLKYQIGTFSDGAGNFKPYFLGLYTGLSYRF